MTDTPPLHLAVALDGAGWHPAAWREPDASADQPELQRTHSFRTSYTGTSPRERLGLPRPASRYAAVLTSATDQRRVTTVSKPHKQVILGAYVGGVNHHTVWSDPAVEDVAKSLRKYASLGITHFVLSDTPYLPEIKRQGDQLLPLLRG